MLMLFRQDLSIDRTKQMHLHFFFLPLEQSASSYLEGILIISFKPKERLILSGLKLFLLRDEEME